jgi:choline dehydrogenase
LIDGKRASSLATYLTDARSRPNFEVLADAHVVRVIFEDRRAVGVEIERGGEHEVIRGDKVVLSAGAIHSPQILMLSGVGPRATLDELGIPVVQDSPGVGATLDDHPIVPVVTLTTTPSEFTGVRVGLRATSEIGAALGLLDDYMVFAAILDPFTMNLDVDTRGKQAFSLIFNLGRPLSRGWLTISSADHREHPELHMNFLSDPRDLARVLAGARQLYHLARAEPLASLIDSIPGLDDDIVGDDSRLEAWVRKVVTTGYHGSGTCRIGPDDDPMAVVDQHLAVRGVENLWVADASINPVIPTAFTNLTAVMVGERLADWLRNDAEVNGVTTNESMAHA